MIKKIISLSLLAFSMLVSCTKPEQVPQILLSAVQSDATSISFTITTDVADKYGYIVRKAEDAQAPSVDEIFAGETGEIKKSGTYTVTSLDPETEYEVYASVSNGNMRSTIAYITMTTTSEGTVSDGIIEIVDVDIRSFTFTITPTNHGENFLFLPVEKALLKMSGVSEEEYLSTYGIRGTGENTYSWWDGDMTPDGASTISVIPDTDYVILAAMCDETGETIISEVNRAELKTLPNAVSDVEVAITLKDITSTSVRVLGEPQSEVSDYYVYVRDQKWFDDILEEYGESMLIELIKYPSAGSKYFEEPVDCDFIWDKLYVDTDYYVAVVASDKNGAESVRLHEFRTLSSSGEKPHLDISLTSSSSDPAESLIMNIECDNAYQVRYVVMATGDIDWLCEEEDKSHTDIINEIGIDLTPEEVDVVRNSGGLDITVSDLWRDTEYTAIVAARTPEREEINVVKSAETMPYTALPVVESSLFTDLVGEWKLSYTAETYSETFTVENVIVSIRQGVDAATEKEYRDLNRLVVTGYQFLPNYASEPAEFSDPASLMDYSPFWSENPSLAYRDYGPKFFLEIAAGDMVTVPTSLGNYLMNFDGSPILMLGCDFDNLYTAPAAFPVEISADKNTILIKEYQAGPEFDYGNYRPGVFHQGSLVSVASSDIRLTRVN